MRDFIVKAFNQQGSYDVVNITASYYQDVHSLMKNNTFYIQLFQSEALTLEQTIHEIKSRPQNTIVYQKCFLGFYDQEQLIAILDLIIHYPNENEAYIGLLMVKQNMQSNGLGKILYKLTEQVMRSFNFNRIELGVVRENKQAFKFWKELGYETLRQVKHHFDQRTLYVTVMEKFLSK